LVLLSYLKVVDRKGHLPFHEKSQHQRMIQENTSFSHLKQTDISLVAVHLVLQGNPIQEPMPLPATEDGCLIPDSGVVASAEVPKRRRTATSNDRESMPHLQVESLLT
jgi:hypothetical protein